MSRKKQQAAEQTITDFGEQWSRFTENEGYYASQDMFADILGPLMSVDQFEGARCAEVGAGSGRISQMVLNAGAAHVTAVEPSRACEVLKANLAGYGDRVSVVNASGEAFHVPDLDIVLSVGVLHHIPDPEPTVAAMYRSLKPGGKALVWLYGREGNGLYLTFAEPLRYLTRRLPVRANSALAALIYAPLWVYLRLCKWLPLPMRSYFRKVLAPMSGKDIRLVIVDQLNPAWAKYYTREEARTLLANAGFENVALHHRHGYSWTVRGTRPYELPQ